MAAVVTEGDPRGAGRGYVLMTNVANIISNRLRETQERLAPPALLIRKLGITRQVLT